MDTILKKDHRGLVDVLETGDAQWAKKKFCNHVRVAKEIVMAACREAQLAQQS